MARENALSTTQRAAVWSGLDVLVRQGSQFVFGVVLARLLAPEAFGLLAILTLFTSLANVLVDGGLGTALIQRERLDEADVSTAFWANLMIATAMAALMIAAAPAIGEFYRQPELPPLIWAMAANTWLTAFITVQRAMLARAMDFRRQTLAAVGAAITAGTIAVMLAAYGAGVWALATQILASTGLNAVLLWWMHPWRPRRTFSQTRLRQMLNFGGFVLLTSLVDAFASRFYAVLIGRLASTRELGYFNQAATVRDFPQLALGNIFSRLALPIYARNAHDREQLRVCMHDAQITAMALNLPAMFGLLAMAEPLVHVLLGPKWLPAVPVLQVLCGAGALWPVHASNLNLLLASGRSRWALRVELVKKSLLLLVLLIASHWGMMAIAWGMLLNSLLSLGLNSMFSGRLAGYPMLKQLYDLLPYAMLAALMAVAVATLQGKLVGLSPLTRLGISVITGMVIYASGSALLGLHAYRRIRHLVESAMGRDP
ncbi:MAG: lipopolysaccharide biosynthesis protein [Pseudomonadota bacterium]